MHINQQTNGSGGQERPADHHLPFVIIYFVFLLCYRLCVRDCVTCCHSELLGCCCFFVCVFFALHFSSVNKHQKVLGFFGFLLFFGDFFFSDSLNFFQYELNKSVHQNSDAVPRFESHSVELN